MNLLLVEAHELDESSAVTLAGDDARAKHLREVLGVVLGSRVRAGVIDGGAGEAEVLALEPLHLRLELGETPPRPRLDLVLALPRPKVLGRLYAPLAQLGVGRVVLAGAARVERYYFDAHQVDPAWARPHLLEGLAQARDTRVPLVSIVRRLDRAIDEALLPAADVVAPSILLVADPGDAVSPHRALRGRSPAPADRVLLVVGPEGGFRDTEREHLRARGFQRIALGPRPLRTDVALIALVAAIHEGLRDD